MSSPIPDDQALPQNGSSHERAGASESPSAADSSTPPGRPGTNVEHHHAPLPHRVRHLGHATSPSLSQAPLPPGAPYDPVDRPAATNLRSAFNANLACPAGPARNRTPDIGEDQSLGAAGSSLDSALPAFPRALSSQQSSPRSVPGGASRRQGIVFQDSVEDPYDSGGSSPPLPPYAGSSVRPRTRTMDASMLAQRSALPGNEHRNRVGSISSSGSQAAPDERKTLAASIDSTGYPSVQPGRPPELAATQSSRDSKKPSSSRRLMKRHSSRPASPVMPSILSVDSFPLSIPTPEPFKVILLMKTLCGRMRGEIEYQGESGATWHSGVAYIDEEKACLMFDSGQHGPFHIALVHDLRGCRVLPVEHADRDRPTIELVTGRPAVALVICPLAPEEYDFWLAALLSWQQVSPDISCGNGGGHVSPSIPARPELKRQVGPEDASKHRNIIKVGKVRIWDKGMPFSARACVNRSSTRDPRSPAMAWRRMSCILQDNGNFKLMMENDSTVVTIIEISQLSRRAVQHLDRTVLDDDHCIAIFPIYSASATSLSVFRPVFLALDSRVSFEVWFALLRVLAKPDVYRLDDPRCEDVQDVQDLEGPHNGEIFRLERTVAVRITEAKIKALSAALLEAVSGDGRAKADDDPLVGDYVAEVVLDGEVRARTITRTTTKNPFWREDCEFLDFPQMIPFLSIVLKRVDGRADGTKHQQQPSRSQVAGSPPRELTCGSVDIALEDLERGRDKEQWLQIRDEAQQSIGSMLVRVKYDEHAVLLKREYKPLCDILHQFNNGLTMQISSILHSHLRRLAELFLNIFQVSGSAEDWLMALVEDEIDGIGNQMTMNKRYRFSNRVKSNDSADSSGDRELMVRDLSKSLAGEANLLFRGNSLLTQSLELYMRRLGQEYLEEVMLDKIREVNELDPDCEVDPSRLQKHGDDLEEHWDRLIGLTTDMWQHIAASAKRIPPELRHILKYVRAVAEDRYGDFCRSVRYTSVSGFLFLRFICPAILSPKLFGLLRDHPQPRAQRTLTFIAKALQTMANLSTFGKREEWMEPMNRFLNAQRSALRDFIDQVCGIPIEHGANAIQASYSTPVTILGRLGPTAREGFPSLPYLIDQPRSLAALVKLWADATPAEVKSWQLDGDLHTFNKMCLSLQERASACLTKMESVRAAEASSHGISDELAEVLEQASMVELFCGSHHHGPSLSFAPGAAGVFQAGGAADLDQPPGSSSSEATEEGAAAASRRRSRDLRRGPGEARKPSGLRQVSGMATGAFKGRNGKVGRTILTSIMRMSGRSDTPEGKGQK